MLAFVLSFFRMVWLFGKDHRGVVLENLALPQQLSIYKRKQPRPRFADGDRWFWITLSVLWKEWRRALVVVHPDTVVRWQRERFRRYWGNLSKKPRKPGRPPISVQVRMLIRTLAEANPLWRAPRIHGELLKLGIAVSERTVSRVPQTVKRPPSQTWKTFLRNHLSEIVAIDFFTVPTIRLRVLFVFLVMEHQRRRVLHFGVTEHPTAEWTSQQITEAFSERDATRYLLRDRDSIYGPEFRDRLHSLAMNPSDGIGRRTLHRHLRGVGHSVDLLVLTLIFEMKSTPALAVAPRSGFGEPAAIVVDFLGSPTRKPA